MPRLAGSQSPLIATAAEAAAFEERMRDRSHVCLGVVSNPFSRTNARTRLYDRILPRFVPDHRNAVSTRTREDFDRAIRYLLFERGVNVLGLNGGDGTLHLGVNRLVSLVERTREETGAEMPLPRLLFLNGGTLNIVSRATGTKGNPARTVRRFVRLSRGRTLGELPLRHIRLLRVEERDRYERPGQSPAVHYGFVFGTEVVANALELYGMFGEGYAGLARFLAELVVGYALNTRLWQEHGWKMDPATSPITVAGVTYPRYTGAVASTIDLTILKGLVTAVRVLPEDEGFNGRVITETAKGRIIRMIPSLMLDRAHPHAVCFTGSSTLRSTGGYTLDGEVFLDRSPRGQRREVEVTLASTTIQAIAPP